MPELQLETRTSAVISTAHLSQSDMELLTQYTERFHDEGDMVVRMPEKVIRLYKEGIEICLATDEHLECMEEIANTLDLSDGFLNNLQRIKENYPDLYSIVFDQDAFLVSGLIEFDW
ncbi:hypothetical protein [Xenorhabdus innexi]|uniref:DUF5983 domain-containing protein n=1 Tax=Xenorhabdus innexi TaxID=290109 RepID=A0A1N6MWJ2_9GAMM|nr:hypothetical protein [Xenorhabdus innexi]PHM35963.1 hypothetical protein Xinn_02033 [Xenorhabdus innexi]SIP73263.1 hypothetical protein XIS1_1790069 [Xenorhabdus innexi]